jgi:2-phospho-L-lactate guanylyltransferase
VSTLALVPVKDLATAKTRLSEVLGVAERRCLVLDLLRVVLHSLQACPQVDRIVVVTSDRDVIAAAEVRGLGIYRHPGGLNAALEAARRDLQAGYDKLLVSLADLPLVTAADFTAMHRLARDHAVVVAPDQAGQGTNVMLLSPPKAIPLSYGPYSCQRHTQAAQRRLLRTVHYQSPTTALDVDTPADLAGVPTALRTAANAAPCVNP